MKTTLGVAVGRLAFAGAIALAGTAASLVAVTWMTQDPRVIEAPRAATPTFELVAPPPELAPPPERAVELPAPVPAPTPSAAQPPIGRTPSTSAPAGLPELASLPTGLPALGSGLPLGAGLSDGLGASPMPAIAETTPDTPARPVTRPAPRYPRTAQLSGIEGVVVVRLRVDERGRVSDVVVVDASPDGVFDEVAVAAAKGYRFAPARKGGKAVATTVEQRIVFRLGR